MLELLIRKYALFFKLRWYQEDKMQAFFFLSVTMCTLVYADIYLHSMRGSNNRLQGRNRNRNNANVCLIRKITTVVVTMSASCIIMLDHSWLWNGPINISVGVKILSVILLFSICVTRTYVMEWRKGLILFFQACSTISKCNIYVSLHMIFPGYV